MNAAWPQQAKRLIVVGTTACGKTTLARQLAAHFGYVHIELDALMWQANWTPLMPDELRARIKAVFAEHSMWVADGNYTAARDVLWSQADTIIWLDYSLWRILWRLTRRTWQRLKTGEELWNGNREELRLVLSRESLYLWVFKTYRRRRRQYLSAMQDPQYAHLTFIHLRSPKQLHHWLEHIQADTQ